LFVALKGPNFDGNAFAQEALDNGAYKVIIDDMRYHKHTGETIFYGNALKLLQRLANYHRHQIDATIIGLTGSNGKTTTKELIASVLKQHYKTEATRGNLNNHIGVPITLLSLTDQTQMGVIEMGANHQGEIAELAAIADPDYGYITNFGKAHLEGFGGVEGVIKGKSELYRHCKRQGSTVIVNGNDEKQMKLTQGMERIVFGDDESDCPVRLLGEDPTLSVEFKGVKMTTRLTGVYNFHNIAAAICLGDRFGIEPELIRKGIEEYEPRNNRSQWLNKGPYKIFLDAYNANPSSMAVAIENFDRQCPTDRLFVLGDMFELGEEAAREHQLIADQVGSLPEAEVWLVGENFYNSHGPQHVKRFRTFGDLENHLGEHTVPAKHIMIKGSRGMALERILDLL
jgi:UDP-N-acetylmuramoyl-tripeptide--D-alanyl-D-alanine ligase